MNTKSEVLEIVRRAAPAPSTIEEVPLQDSLERVLARDAVSDVDVPPFKKSSMDGWAVRSADAAEAGAQLAIRGRVMAGSMPEAPVESGETMKVMTGAPLPDGADSVVMVEQSVESVEEGKVTLTAATRAGSNVCQQGEDLRKGERLLAAGTFLDPSAIGLLAMVGMDPVPTWRPPSVAVIPTGDELVESGGPPPAPGMIRESNGVLLETQVQQVSRAIHVVRPGIARDDEASLNTYLDVGLGHDVLCLSGGVSMGDLDLVGRVLEQRGLEVLVHKAAIKPGKPFLFGRITGDDGHVCHVFGLPGNPVSTFVTFELFVRPFLLAGLGCSSTAPDLVHARLAGRAQIRPNPRTQHIPAVVTAERRGLVVTPVDWHGSADLRALADANSLIVVESKGGAPRQDERVLVHLLPGKPLAAPASPSRGAEA